MKFYIRKLLLGFLFLIMTVSTIFAQTVDLSNYVKNNLAPSGTTINWYSVANPDPNNPNTNLVGSYTSTSITPVNVNATSTPTDYYAFFYDSTNKCFSPGYKMTLVANTCPATQVDLNPLSKSVAPSGAVLEWHTSSTPSSATLVAIDNGVTPILVGDGVYFPVYHDTTNNCYSPVGSPIVVKIIPCYCYKTGASSGTAITTTHGITALGRAGADNGNWPMVRQSAWTVLEAKTKGFVVNRIDNIPLDAPGNPGQVPTSVIASPIEGMMVYDIQNKCLKIYANSQWACFTKQTCPDY